MKKHIFFDMDGTLTPSRQAIQPNMEELLTRLARMRDVVIVSGAQDDQMARQIPRGTFPAIRLSQNGNVCMGSARCPRWRNELTWRQKMEVFLWIERFRPYEIQVDSMDDLVEDRGCQVSYSLLGHHAPLEKKRAFDPDGGYRRDLLRDFPFDSRTVKHAIGGTTCIDFYLHTKGENVGRLVAEMGWLPGDCLYVGDALFDGGNDATVKGVVETLQVRDHNECARVVLELLAKV